MIKIAPSILAADFTQLGNDIKSVGTADYLHFDVMDGVFVPNISFGIPVLESVRKITDMILDVHLMINKPSRYVEKFAEKGGDIITFHIEAESPEITKLSIDIIHKQGKKAGLSLRPNTPVESLMPFIDSLDMILLMTVDPGYGGQDFISSMLPKISKVRNIIDKHNLQCELEVDGGINPETAGLCIDAGANVLVAGNDVFNAVDRAAHIDKLRNSIRGNN